MTKDLYPCAAAALFGQYKIMQKKDKEKLLKPWHMGTHLRVLSESYPMNTNMTGFRRFSNILASLSFITLVVHPSVHTRDSARSISVQSVE